VLPRKNLGLLPAEIGRQHSLSKKPFAKGFGGKESVKGNRQGFLSCAIRPLFETFCGASKSEAGCRESPVGLS